MPGSSSAVTEGRTKMITVLDLDPITKALCLTAVAAVWAMLFYKLYKRQTGAQRAPSKARIFKSLRELS
jgi:hypothetical protein